MGKTVASKTKPGRTQRHDPLHAEYGNSADQLSLRKPTRQKFVDRNNRDENDGEEYLDPKLSKKILKIAREQQESLKKADGEDEDDLVDQQTLSRLGFPSNASDDEAGDEDFGGEYEEVMIEEEDADVLSKFMPSAPKERMTLADLIMDKINQKEESAQRIVDGDSKDTTPSLSPKVMEVYQKVGVLLSRYKSGKLPKAFKIIPSLSNWEEILYLTEPDNWSPHATYEATRMFVSNLKANQAQRFFSFVLLDRVRDDIQENKKLHYYLYLALKKALYKPQAFFKGILFPLCESGTCTLKEASIIGSVLTRVSIPVLHSSAALKYMAEMDYTGPNSLFIRILLDKKYALPYKVIDAVVEHFQKFENDEREMPVLWHQSLLVFAQRYKDDLVPEQREILLRVIRKKFHAGITPEVRRELANATARDEVMDIDDIVMMD